LATFGTKVSMVVVVVVVVMVAWRTVIFLAGSLTSATFPCLTDFLTE
jgi:hypothetical protein